MIIEVRPTPRLRRYRGRLVGGALALAMLATSFAAVAELTTPGSPAAPATSHLTAPHARP